MDIRRIQQVCEYGWKDAIALSQEESVNKGKLSIFLDILSCFFKYNVWSNQYKKEKLHLLSGNQKKEICLKYQEKNTKRDLWVKSLYNNYRFLEKWSKFKYDATPRTQQKRCKAYQKHYDLPADCFIGHSVFIQKRHYQDSTIKLGSHCLIASNTDVDYTGNIILENNVSMSEGVRVLTHNHQIGLEDRDEKKGCICTPLTIRDRVWIGTRAIIMPGVNEIGRAAVIAAGACVRSIVPPYAVVMGNPAKIVGFRLPPKEIVEYEKEHYPESERIPLEVLEKNYDKYFKNRIKEIKEFVKQ